jgi:predicted HTH domain antitoxin
MKVTVDLPADFVEMQTPEVVQREMRLAYAIELFKTAKVSLSKASELAGLTLHGFMLACGEHRVPVIDMTPGEWLEELSTLASS